MTQKILYIQHAGALGGSCMSLLFLIQGLDRTKYEPIVACIHDTSAVLDLYRSHDIETFFWPGITPFEHTTLGWFPLYDPLAVTRLARQIRRFLPSAHATQQLVKSVRPDVVHLNSLVLAPSALGVRRAGIPLIWHVREPVHHGHVGLRRRFLARLFMRLADEGIFISAFDQQQLTGGKKGTVVHNFVDFTRFDYSLNGETVRAELNLAPGARLVLFLGGQSVVKGIFPLLQAMALVRDAVPEAHLAVGSGAYTPSGRLLSRIARTVLPLVGSGTVAQRVDKLIAQNAMQDRVHLLSWRSDVPRLLAASDVLVFPSVAPHFARPVVEAGAMKKPVVASRIGGVEELVVHEETGLLVPPNDPVRLADALIRILTQPDEAQKMGKNGRQHALSRFNAETNIKATTAAYERLLGTKEVK
ncbi:MAG TPA: glycosyltransferase family 4 protein [Aggregatilineaceae bacterium]|nr:glycosyltransferase family 4 protein [Aggregatilineaceae bacterium]